MTPPASTPRTLVLATVLLGACGDDGTTTATVTDSGTGGVTMTQPPVTDPTTTHGTGTHSATEVTGGGMSMEGSETGSSTGPGTVSDTSSTSLTSTTTPGTTVETTTNPIDTDASTSTTTTGGPETTTGTTLVETTVDPDTTDTTDTDSTTGDPIMPCECPDIEVPLDDGIFVLSDNAQLWKFFPETLSFDMLGSFNCQGDTSTFSMAVDRLGYAWVMFNSGKIGLVDVTNPGVCLDSGYVNNQQGVNLFGMGFVSNSAFDACDSLFGNTFNGLTFSEGPNQGTFLNMKPDDLLINKLGPTTFNGAEVTGTGDGRVFLFGGVNPAKIVEVNRLNGQYIDVLPLNGVATTLGFAFAFFAGDFYVFTESDELFDTVSKVTHVDYDDSDNNGIKDVKKVVAQTPIRIVGAGVSTCAPFLPQ